MTVRGWKGQIVHHDACHFCKHSMSTPAGKKRKAQVELCRLDGQMLPSVHSGLPRYCDHYQQVGCDCEDCARTLPKEVVVERHFPVSNYEQP